MTIYHSSWASTLRIVNDRQDITSGGNVYSAFPFEVLLPAEDTEQQQVHTKVKLSNVDRQMIATLRGTSTEPTVTVSLALASTPSTIELGPMEFIMSSYDYDAAEITGILTYENILNEPIPGDTFNPQDYPGVFA